MLGYHTARGAATVILYSGDEALFCSPGTATCARGDPPLPKRRQRLGDCESNLALSRELCSDRPVDGGKAQTQHARTPSPTPETPPKALKPEPITPPKPTGSDLSNANNMVSIQFQTKIDPFSSQNQTVLKLSSLHAGKHIGAQSDIGLAKFFKYCNIVINEIIQL